MLANPPARARLAVVGAAGFLLLGSVGILPAVTPATAATSHSASLGAHGAATWTVGRSVSVDLKAMTPGIWRQELWSNTCAAPIARLAVLPSVVVPATRTLRKTTRATVVPATGLGVTLRLVNGSSTVCGVFITSPRAKYEGDCDHCFVFDLGPPAPVADPSTAGWTYRPGDPRKIIYLDENFQLPAGTTATFDNKIVIVKPIQRKNVRVSGTLAITNSLVLWRQAGPDQSRLEIEKGGVLSIKNSYAFSGNAYIENWQFDDGSTIDFDHFVGDPWMSMGGSVTFSAVNFSTVRMSLFSDLHDAHVRITNAHEVWFEIFPPEGTSTFTLPAKRRWEDWTISDLWPNTTVEVHDSYVYERDITLMPNTHVTVQDTPSGLGIGWIIYKETPPYVTCELSNVGTPGMGTEGKEDGQYYAETTWDLPCDNSSMTVRNTRVLTVWPHVWGFVHLKVHHSNLAEVGTSDDSGNTYGPVPTVEIYESSLLQIYAGGGHVYVERSRISDLIEARGPSTVVYGYGVTGPYKVLTSDGGVYVPLDKPGPPW